MASFRELMIVDLDRTRVGFGEVGADAVHLRSAACGDEVRVDVRLDGDRVRAVAWNGHGCTVSMASASALAALVIGLTVTEFRAMREEFAALVKGPVPPDEPDEPDESDQLDESDGESATTPRLGDAEAFAGIGRLPLRAGCATLAWRALDASLPA